MIERSASALDQPQGHEPRGQACAAPLSRTARVVVNARAGTVLAARAARFRQDLAAAFAAHNVVAHVEAAPPRGLAAALARAVDARPDMVLLGGGDGTISGLLPILAASPVPAGVLPLGTLNLLARDLGLGGDPLADAAALAAGAPRRIDLAEINGRLFHSNAGLGLFTMMARQREQSRRRLPSARRIGFAFAALRTILRARPVTVEIELDGRRQVVEADAVLVTNNCFEGTPWLRASLTEGVLEVHLLQAGGLAARLRAALAMLRGSWRSLPRLTSLRTTQVTLQVHRRRRRTSRVAIDGELQRMDNHLELRARPGALTLLAPSAPLTASISPAPS